MRNLTLSILTLLTVLVMPSTGLFGKTVILDPIADCTVDSSQPDTIFAGDESLWPAKIGVTGSTGDIRLSYVQYQLPGDIEEITAAKFLTVQTTNNGSFAYYVNGLKDEVPQPSPDTYTWNNAPGNNITNMILADGNLVDGTVAVYSAYITTNRTHPVGTEYPDVLNSVGMTLLKDDTDGIVTFYLVRRHISPVDSGLAAVENTEYHPIQIELTYTPALAGELVLDAGDGVQVNELGATSDTYTAALTAAPTSDVTVNLDYDAAQISVSPSPIVFTPTDYDAVTVTVTAIDDTLAEGEHTVTITHATESADLNYKFAPEEDVDVVVTGNNIRTAIITASADSMVKPAAPNTAFPTGDLDPQRDPNDGLTIGYLQFQLPVDFEYAVDADIRLVRTYVSPYESDLYVVGLHDDVEVGDVNTFTWNNAPGVDTTADANDVPGHDTSFGYTADTIDVPLEGAVGDEVSGIPSTNTRLTGYLNNDTDGVVTLMLIRVSKGLDEDSFASSESVSYHGPQLILQYSDSAHCGQPGQTYNVRDVDQDCYVNLADLAELTGNYTD